MMWLLIFAAILVGKTGATIESSFLSVSSLKVYPRAKWTVAVYMNGDNELEDSITGGFAVEKGTKTELPGDFHSELAVSGSNSDVHVLALIDRSPDYASNMDNWNNTRLYYVEKDNYPDNTHGTFWINDTSFGADEFNMANPTTLTTFIKTIQTQFPSDYLYLSMWDHNWGWHSGWFQKDETSGGDTMSYPDLFKTLRRDKDSLLPIDILGYDACVASQIEVLHTWRPFAHSFVGSQDYVGWGGVDYSLVIAAIQAKPDISPDELSTVIADSMLTDITDNCASAFHLDASFDRLVSHVDELALLFIERIEEIHPQLIAIRETAPQTPHYPADEFHRDLFGVATEVITQLSAHPDIVHVAEQIQLAFKSSLLYNKLQPGGGKSCKGGKGLTIFWTKSGKRVEKDYYATSFALATHWDEFLSVF